MTERIIETACPNCGYEYEINVEEMGEVTPPPSLETIRCGLCRKNVSGPACTHCGWFRELFHRFCPACSEGVPADADTCPHCHQSMPVAVKGYDHVVCLGCPAKRQPEQVDDWFAKRRQPYLVPTRKGEKSRTLDPEKGAEFVQYFFNPDGLSVEECQKRLLDDDSQAWKFTNQERAEEYFNLCACPDCGRKNWVLSTVEGLRMHIVEQMRVHGPAVRAGAKAALIGGFKVVGGGWRLLREAGQAAKAKKKGKGGEKKGGRAAETAESD